MSRTPLIAGNWKMHKTVEEAEDFIQALLPKLYATDGADVALERGPLVGLGVFEIGGNVAHAKWILAFL